MCWRLTENCDKYLGADQNSTQGRNEQQHGDNTPVCFSERIFGYVFCNLMKVRKQKESLAEKSQLEKVRTQSRFM